MLYNNAYDNLRIDRKDSIYTSIYIKTNCNFSVILDIRTHVGFGLGMSTNKFLISTHITTTIEEMNNNE